MKLANSTISAIVEHALDNRRAQIAAAALLAVLTVLLGPSYPGGVGVALVLLLAGLAAVLGWASADSDTVGTGSTIRQTCLRKPAHAMFAFYAFVLVVGQHPSILGFAGAVGLTVLAVYLGRHAGRHRARPEQDDPEVVQAVGLLESQGYLVTRPE